MQPISSISIPTMPQNSSIVKGCKMVFQRLEDLRVDKDMTQQKVADLLNCKREVYRRYERGIREIPIWALIKLADFYHVSIDYILGRTDNPKSFWYIAIFNAFEYNELAGATRPENAKRTLGEG